MFSLATSHSDIYIQGIPRIFLFLIFQWAAFREHVPYRTTKFYRLTWPDVAATWLQQMSIWNSDHTCDIL